MTEGVAPSARLRLHPLAARRDGDEWIVGRVATGDFVALPPVGVRAVEMLRDGLSVAETSARLTAETGEELDTLGFVRDLIGLGFVAEVGGQPVPSPEPPPPTFPRLLPRHVRWTLSPVLPPLLGALVLAAVLVLLRRPGLLPGYRSLLWNPHGSLVLGLGFLAGWLLLLIHECAHLAVARATGVPARIRLGTRLQFLVMQTDISGIELASRRHRMTAYLAGMAVNVAVSATAVLLLARTGAGTTAHRVLAALVLLAVLPLPFQFMVFMRTDVYFVLQDLTGCRDLHGDGRAYARYAARTITRRRPRPADPSLELPARERQAVRIYSAVLVVGTALCLATLATVTVPTDVTMLVRAAARLGPGHPALDRLDAAVVLAVLGGAQLMWLLTWWRGRRRRTPRRLT